MINPGLDALLLAGIEDAGLNSSAPPQQRWVDGWLLRFSPGKAKRARCINAVASGRMSVDAKLELCEPVYRAARLPLMVRITPFSLPAGLDQHLQSLGMHRIDDTRVMVLPTIDESTVGSAPDGHRLESVGAWDFAQLVGEMRGSPLAQRQAHGQRLELSPVPFKGYVLRDDDGRILACGQFAIEAELVGLFDVFTEPTHRGNGLASALCRHLLALASAGGARVAYLQVEGDNLAARRVYHRIGFADAYAYHYRCAEPAA